MNCDACVVREPLVRSEIYHPETKCCQFSPFWSAFGIGAWLKSGGNKDYIHSLKAKGFLFSPLGILHDFSHRLDKKALCWHFDKDKGCSIWTERPPICFSFFCASQYPDGLLVYGKMEAWLLKTEAKALKLWFQELNLSDEFWSQWGECMEAQPSVDKLPNELIINDVSQAIEFYENSWSFINRQETKDILQGEALKWQKGLAQDPLLC